MFKLNVVDGPAGPAKTDIVGFDSPPVHNVNIDSRIYGAVRLRHANLGQLSPDDAGFMKYCWDHMDEVNSQCFQDFWVAYETKEKKNGFFVEFGATDGIKISNTLYLEKKYGWSGILSEPSPDFFPLLKQNRSRQQCFDYCVSNTKGNIVQFIVAKDGELSAVEANYTRPKTIVDKKVSVETITLFDLLEAGKAPSVVDYLSVDTEGGEFETLEKFFEQSQGKYTVEHITVEHNYHSINRDRIKNLLNSLGYVRKFEYISSWDDFYKLKG